MKRLVAAWLYAAASAHAQPLQLPPQPVEWFAPVPGSQLPLDRRFRDTSGREVKLGAYFGGAPVVLIPGYYACPNLCSTVFEGALQALTLSRVPASAYRVIGLSIDPAETPALAARSRTAYRTLLPASARFDLLTGDRADIARVTSALGYRFTRTPDGQFAHAAGFVVVRPDGRIAQAFGGIRPDPAVLRSALEQSAGGGPVSMVQQFFLRCAHYDPSIGAHTAAAMWAVRAAAACVALALATWAWRRRVR
jgi:protein SCO1/2